MNQCVAIHKYMESMLRISLYSSLSLLFSLQQNLRRTGQNMFYLEAVGGGVSEWEMVAEQGCGTMYTYVSKCKNDKIIGKTINKRK
jgi:hypothetical protein